MTTQNLHRKLINYSQNDTVSFPYCVYPCNPKLTHIAGASPAPSPATTVVQLQPPSSNHHNHHHQLLSLPLKISLIFLFATFIYTLYKFYTIWFRSRRRRAPATASPENQETRDHDYNDGVDHPIWYIRTTGLSPSVINGITVVKFDKSDRVIDGTDCSVCLTEFDGDDMLRLLPSCKHAFHVSCIDTWLRSHTNCPLCRAGIEDDTVDGTLDERNNGGESGFIGDRTSLAVLVVRDGDQGEASGSSVVRIGEGDELDVNNNVSKREG